MARTRARRRRNPAFDSDPDTEDGSDYSPETQETMTEARRKAEMEAIMMNDLGSSTRDFITSVDKGSQKPVNLRGVLADRACNQEGTEAAALAAKNKSALAGWGNYWTTVEAKADVVEELRDISGGQSHREPKKEQLAAQQAALGRELRLEDTYDEVPRHGKFAPPKLGRGRYHAAANDRGHYSAARGGGFVGRGPGRLGGAAQAQARPLDPAVDPTRAYKYRNGPGYQPESGKMPGRKAQASIVNNTVMVKPAVPTGTKIKSAMGEKQTTPTAGARAAKDAHSPALSATQKMKSVPKITKAGASSSGATSATRTQKAPAARLADENTFMEAASHLLTSIKTKSAPSKPSASTSTKPTKPQSGLLARKYATVPNVASPVENRAQIHRLAREEFRDPDLSPDQLTDALPSTGNLSITSPSLQSEKAVGEDLASVGLGIKGISGQESDSVTNDDVTILAAQQALDLMDTEVPDVRGEALIASPAAKSPSKEMVSIPKSEAQQWAAFKACMDAGDTSALARLVRLRRGIPVSTAKQNTSGASLDVAKAYVVDSYKISDIVGEQNLSKGVSTQTTPSLAHSKWASASELANNNIARSLPSKPQHVAPVGAQAPRTVSPISTSSTSSTATSASSDGIVHQPETLISSSGKCANLVVKGTFERVSSTRTDLSSNRDLTATTKLTTTPGSSTYKATNHVTRIPPSYTARANPFPSQDSVATHEITLDYGEPAKLKPLPSTLTSDLQILSNQSPSAVGKHTSGNSTAISALPVSFQQNRLIEVSKDTPSMIAQRQKQDEPPKDKKHAAATPKSLDEQIVAALRKAPDPKVSKHIPEPHSKFGDASSTTSTQLPWNRPGLAASKYATGLPAQHTSMLQPRSTNQSPQKLLEGAIGRSRRHFRDKADHAIFGDGKILSRIPPADNTTATLLNSSEADERGSRKSTAVKRDAPGPGFDLLVQDLQKKAVISASKAAEPVSPEVRTAVTKAKELGKQFGVVDGEESDESEL